MGECDGIPVNDNCLGLAIIEATKIVFLNLSKNSETVFRRIGQAFS
jgi:hypothetical protein